MAKKLVKKTNLKKACLQGKSKKFIGKGDSFKYASLDDFDKFTILPSIENV